MQCLREERQWQHLRLAGGSWLQVGGVHRQPGGLGCGSTTKQQASALGRMASDSARKGSAGMALSGAAAPAFGRTAAEARKTGGVSRSEPAKEPTKSGDTPAAGEAACQSCRSTLPTLRAKGGRPPSVWGKRQLFLGQTARKGGHSCSKQCLSRCGQSGSKEARAVFVGTEKR